ncbi:MAG: glycolate oxidase subunit GlcE [bacterium]
MKDSDTSKVLQQQVVDALDADTPLAIVGGSTKAFYGYPATGEVHSISTLEHSGVVAYEPSELVVTVRAGTPLKALEQLLDEHRQVLPFEPPCFGENSTIGGVVAAGLSGPARFRQGAIRDSLLGVKIINGRGEILEFGGQVMKNVAGYDLSRLMAGSLGTLGLLLEVSLKLRAKAPRTLTLQHEVSASQARQMLRQWYQLPGIISATAYHENSLSIRLDGSDRALDSIRKKLGGVVLETAGEFWASIRNQSHPFFTRAQNLWRLAVTPMSPEIPTDGHTLEEWGGGLRWIDAPPEEAKSLRQQASSHGGHATLFRTSASEEALNISRFHPLPTPMMKLHSNLKQSLDPKGIFNPGRLYQEL